MENIFLVKFMGFFMFITGSALFLSKETRSITLENIKNNKIFLIIMGYIQLIIGIPIVILHNVWELSFLGLVTILGWLTVIKGFIFLAKPSMVKKKELSEKKIKIRSLISALIGLGLIFFVYYPYFK